MKSILSTIALVAALASSVASHASLSYPCPRYSPEGENCPAVPPGESYDVQINAPIHSVTLGGTMPLCRHTTPYATPSATWTAGQSVTIKFWQHIAAHTGGHCQFSISYDGGKTFAVIHEELKYCFFNSQPSGYTNTPEVTSYTFTLPKDLPSSDKAVFSWTWVNASGNREFYMNCADVAIKGGSSSGYTGKEMTIANYPGYPTIPEFGGNYDTGLEYYNNANKITVSPSGSGGSSPSGNSSNSSESGGSYSTDSPASSAVSSDVGYSAAPSLSVPASADSDSGTLTVPSGYSAAPSPSAPSGPSSGSGSDTEAPAPPSSSSVPEYVGPESNYETTPENPRIAKNTSENVSCSNGKLQCTSDGSGFQVCINRKWSDNFACAPGTVCKQTDSGTLYCGASN